MFRYLKTLGLSLVAAFAITAIAASAAQAENEFTASQYPATVTGQQKAGKDYEFVFAKVTVTCATAEFQGAIGTATLEFTQFLIKSGGCTAVIGAKIPVLIRMNNCDFHAKNAAMKKDKTVKCKNANEEVELVVFESEKAEKEGKSLCVFGIFPQSEFGTVEYENVAGSPEDVVAKENLTGIGYTVKGSKLLCGSSGSSGEIHGETTFTAKNEKGEAIGFMIG